ncbi:MAG: hypothetical protein QOH04_1545 [Sphingomonadales bacterium]|jgi:hypothetical protein|nr:hypothetical protein [Sphingomonadales bacterium]MEA3035780.1 hypothetical protein [Sphingomonadales bacterium]
MISRWRTPFPLFVAGALLYAAVVAIFIRRAGGGGALTLLELSVPLFGLPFLLSSRRTRWRLAVYFLLLVPAFHYLAVLAAIESVNWRSSGFLPGMIGGLTGAALSFAALPVLRLARFRRAGIMLVGVALLGLLGGLGVWQMDYFAGTILKDYGLVLTLYLPWQTAFGFFLSRLLPAAEENGLAAGSAPA